MHLILFAYNNLFITKTKSCSLTKVCCIKNSVVIDVFATPGALRKKSIETCNGITYGLHSDGKGGTHWHRAEAHSKMSSGWAAVGDPILSDPCLKNSSSNSNQSNNNSSNKSNNIASNSNSKQNNSTTTIKKKSNDTSIKYLNISGKFFYEISDITTHIVYSNKVSILVVTNDKNAKYEIQGNINELVKDKINEFKIIVTAEDGTKKTYLVNITREIKESYVIISSLKVNNNSISFGINKKEEILLSSNEDKLNIEYDLSDEKATLVITADGKEVMNGSAIEIGITSYLLTVIDVDGNENSYELLIERMSSFDEMISGFIGIATTGGVGYFVYRLVSKNRKNKK